MSDRVLAAQTAKPPALCRRLAALPSSPIGAELGTWVSDTDNAGAVLPRSRPDGDDR